MSRARTRGIILYEGIRLLKSPSASGFMGLKRPETIDPARARNVCSRDSLSPEIGSLRWYLGYIFLLSVARDVYKSADWYTFNGSRGLRCIGVAAIR